MAHLICKTTSQYFYEEMQVYDILSIIIIYYQEICKILSFPETIHSIPKTDRLFKVIAYIRIRVIITYLVSIQ